MRVATVAVILLAMALAGCLGGDDVDVEDEGDKVDEDAGMISGEVTNAETFEPIPEVRIRLIESGETLHETFTSDNGTYLITNVDPGQYRVHAFNVAMSPAIEQVRINPGQSVKQNFLLEPIQAPVETEPFLDGPFDFGGLWSCGINPPETNNPISPCSSTDPNHAWRFTKQVRPGLRTIYAVVKWDAQPGSDELQFRIVNQVGGDYVYYEETASSPIVVELNAEDFAEAPEERQFEFYDDPEAKLVLRFEVRPSAPGVVYGQKFDVHYAFHHWETGDSGYRPDE